MQERVRSWKKYGIGALAMFVLVSVIPGGPRWAEAAVTTASQVFVTNTASSAVPTREQNLDTSKNIKVHEQGTAKVSITNGTVSVSTRPLASTPWSHSLQVASAPQLVFAPPAGKTTLALTSLTSANPVSSPQQVNIYLYSGTNCNSFSAWMNFVSVPASDTIHQDFPQPIVLAPGGSNWSMCAVATTSAEVITAVGYYY